MLSNAVFFSIFLAVSGLIRHVMGDVLNPEFDEGCRHHRDQFIDMIRPHNLKEELREIVLHWFTSMLHDDAV